ncbi:MAG TPA: SHOCT domain-containing protein [Candidatus Binatia bacterium]|nr:SHOCT domain-containing protein [Candidatus Binatia bacterium]
MNVNLEFFPPRHPGQSARRTWGDERPNTAFEILRQRYARGEIKKEEFEAKKKDR